MKKKLLLTSILSLLMCVSLIAGATFALFTSEANVNMTVTSGEVKIEAKITGTQYKTLTEDYTDFTGTKDLDLGGSISVTDDGKVKFNKILPGDGIKFNIEVLNGSNVSVNYRTVITNSATSNADLFSVLAVKLNGEEFTGEAVSNWALLTPGTNGNTVEVEVELPDTVDGEEYMNKTCEFNVLVEAVQGNAPVANVNASGTTKDETIVEDAKGNEAVAPAGVQLNDGEKTLTLQVKELAEEDANTGNFEVSVGSTAYPFEVKIPEVSANNEKAIVVTMEAPASLSNVVLFHKGVAMTSVASVSDVDEHHEFYYDPAGSITFATKNFSNFTLVDGLVGVVFVSNEDQLLSAVYDNANAKEIVFNNDITLKASKSNGYGAAGILVDGKVINGNGYEFCVRGANDTWDSSIGIKSGTVKNLIVSGAMRGIFMPGATGDVIIDNVKFYNVIYTFNSDAGSKEYSVTITNSVLSGWTSFSDVHKSVTFENCTFNKGCGYQFCRPYNDVSKFINCAFEDGFEFDTTKCTAEFEDCTYAGVLLDELNEENYNKFFYNFESSNHSVKIIVPTGIVSYRPYILNGSRKAIQIDMENIYAKKSLVVELWHNDTLLTTTTYLGSYPCVKPGYTTCCVAMPGSAFFSWDTTYAEGIVLTADNVPNAIKVYADGKLTHTFTHSSGTVFADKVNDYLKIIG